MLPYGARYVFVRLVRFDLFPWKIQDNACDINAKEQCGFGYVFPQQCNGNAMQMKALVW